MADDARDVVCHQCGERLRPEGRITSPPGTYTLDMNDYLELAQELADLEMALAASRAVSSGRLNFVRNAILPVKSIVEAHYASCSPPPDLAGLPFGARKFGATSSLELFFVPPVEIEHIKRGVHTEYVGLFINDGIARWCGFDLDTCQAMKIERFGGRCLPSAPEVPSPTPTHFRRNLGIDRVEVVTIKPLTDEQIAELVQTSNLLWISPARFFSHATDVHNALVLRDGAEAKSFGGPGRLIGPARKLAELLERMLSG